LVIAAAQPTYGLDPTVHREPGCELLLLISRKNTYASFTSPRRRLYRVEMEAARTRLKHAIDRVRAQVKAVEEEHRERQLDRAAHPYWGSPFMAESELSSFGEQVELRVLVHGTRR
jgi:hypothetical protein